MHYKKCNEILSCRQNTKLIFEIEKQSVIVLYLLFLFIETIHIPFAAIAILLALLTYGTLYGLQTYSLFANNQEKFR